MQSLRRNSISVTKFTKFINGRVRIKVGSLKKIQKLTIWVGDIRHSRVSFSWVSDTATTTIFQVLSSLNGYWGLLGVISPIVVEQGVVSNWGKNRNHKLH